jgi:PAS domain S-box-containing protein
MTSTTDVARAAATMPDLAATLALLQAHVGTMEAAIGRAMGETGGAAAATLSDAMLAFLRDELGCDLGWVRLGEAGSPPRLLRHTLGHTLAGRAPGALEPLLAALQSGGAALAGATAPRWLYAAATGADDPALATAARALGLGGVLGVPLRAMAEHAGSLGTLAVGVGGSALVCPEFAQLLGLLSIQLGRSLGYLESLEALRRDEENARVVVEEATDGIYIVDARGIFSYVNPQIARYLGYDADELLERHFSEFVVAESIPLAQASLDRAIAREPDVATKDLDLRRKDGVVRTFEINGRNRYDPHDGHFIGRFGLARDITERRQLEAELARRTRALEALNAIATLAGRSSDLHGLLVEALDRTLGVFALRQGAIFLIQPDAAELLLAASRGYGKLGQVRLARPPADTPLAGMLLASEQPLIGGDLASEVPLFAPLARRVGIGRYGCVPLRSQEQTLGILLVSGGEERALSSIDGATLAIVGAQLGAAIENARLSAETTASRARLEERATQLGSLLTVSAGFTTNRPLGAVLDSVAAAIVETLGFGNAHIRVRADDGDALIGVGFHGYGPEEIAILRAPTPLAAYRQLLEPRFRLGGVQYIPRRFHRHATGVREWPAAHPAAHDARQEGRWRHGDKLLVPLRARDGALLGVICVAEPRDGRVPDLERAAVLELFGRQAALAIENAELYSQIARDLHRQRVLREMIEHSSAELDLNRLPEQLLGDAVELLGGDAGAFGLFDREGGTARIGTLNAMPRTILDTIRALGQGDPASPLAAGRPLLVAPPPTPESAVRAALGVPVSGSAGLIAAFFVGATDPARRFSRAETETLELFAKHAALALGNARLYQEARAQAARLETLRGAIERISSELDLATLLNQLAISAVQFLDADYAAIALVDDETGELRVEAGYNLPSGVPDRRLSGVRWPRDPATGKARPVLLNADEPFPPDVPGGFNLGHGHIAVPIWWQERMIGSFSLSTVRPEKRFTRADLETLGVLARHAAVAIENAGLYSALRERYSQVEGISTVGTALIESRDLDTILQTVARQIVALIGADGCAIFLLPADETDWGEDTELRLVANVGVGLGSFEGRRLPFYGSVTGQAIRDRAPLVLADILAGPPELTPILRHEGIDSLLTVPLQTSSRLIGAINAYGLPGKRFGPRAVEITTLFAHQAAVAIENAWLHQRGRALAVVEERNRLAREIHDTLAQGFTGIILQLQVAESLLEGEEPAARERLTRAQELARASLHEARRSVLNLRPSPLQGRTLPEALAAHLATWRGHTGIAARFSSTGTPRPLDPETEEALLRVAQEALNNTYKHARASQVEVTLTIAPDRVRLMVCDDGTGFVPGPQGGTGGFGLVSMRERVARLAGDLAIESGPGQGTCLQATIADHGPPARRAAGSVPE